MFATVLSAYGTDARDPVISAELVFIGHHGDHARFWKNR